MVLTHRARLLSLGGVAAGLLLLVAACSSSAATATPVPPTPTTPRQPTATTAPSTATAVTGTPAATPAPAADMGKFGYPTAAASRTIQPTERATISAGSQSATITPGTFGAPVKFEFLTGDNAEWQKQLNDPAQTVIATFAFRATDINTNQLIGRPSNPIQWSMTDPRITAAAAVYASTPASPPQLFKFPPERRTVNGQTISATFTATVAGWFVTIPASSATGQTAFQVNIANTAHAKVTVPVGTTVVWTNKDPTQHTVTSGQNGQFDGKGWNSDPVDPGKTFSRAFAALGAFTYTCRIHPTMNATVTVVQSGTPSAAQASSGSDYSY